MTENTSDAQNKTLRLLEEKTNRSWGLSDKEPLIAGIARGPEGSFYTFCSRWKLALELMDAGVAAGVSLTLSPPRGETQVYSVYAPEDITQRDIEKLGGLIREQRTAAFRNSRRVVESPAAISMENAKADAEHARNRALRKRIGEESAASKTQKGRD